LDILAEKRSFDGKIMGLVLDDQFRYLFMNEAEPFIGVFAYRQLQNAHFDQADAGATAKYQAITHYYGARIDAKNYFRGLFQKDDYFWRRLALLKTNIKIILNWVVGPTVFLLLSWFICRQVTHRPNWRESLERIYEAITGASSWKIWLAVALMPVNWGIEARKWQLALRPIGGISYMNALKAVFTGTTMASFTPNRMGEYLGRLLYVKEGHRIESIALTIVCSMAQLLVTLAMGFAGVLYLRASHAMEGSGIHDSMGFWLNTLLGLVSLLVLSLTIIYFRLSWLLRILSKIPGLAKYQAYVKILENFDAALLMKILFLSFGRYLVFIVQYGLIFPVFGVLLTVGQVCGGMSVVFLVMAIIPTFTFLTELGLRWETSIQVLELFSSNTIGIFAVSFAIWLVNMIVPALIGSLLMLSIKIFKNK
jgi:hypothetical protein